MRPTLAFCATLLVASAAAPPATAQDADWYPSRYGADDTLGALNNLSSAKVLQAARLIKTGKTYALGVETGPKTPAFGARSFQMVAMPSGDGSGAPQGTNLTTGNDDLLITFLGIGTQLDGLGHLGINHRYYNGVHVSDFLRADGVIRYGTHELPPIVTRGVLLDMARAAGVERLSAGTALNRAELQAAAQAQGVTLESGDVVLLHTGWQALASEDPEQFLAGEPGLGLDGARYLAGLGVVAVGGDVWALEVLPSEDPEHAYPVHQELLARNGVYVLENIRTEELARDGAWEFLFVLGQPRFVGAVQVVVNPVAIR